MTQELKPGPSSATTSPADNRHDPSPPAATTPTRRRTYAEVMDEAEERFAQWLREENAEFDRKRKGLPRT